MFKMPVAGTGRPGSLSIGHQKLPTECVAKEIITPSLKRFKTHAWVAGLKGDKNLQAEQNFTP